MNGKLADLDLVALVLGRRLGQADARHLRLAVGAARDVRGRRSGARRSRRRSSRRRARPRGSPCARARAGRRRRRWHRRRARRCGTTRRSRCGLRSTFTPGAFEAEVLDVADDADGADHPVDGDLLGSCRRSRSCAVTLSAPFFSALTVAPVRIFMPCFSNALLGEGRDLLVLDRQDAVAAPRPPSPRRPWCGRSSRTRCRSRPSRSTSSDFGIVRRHHRLLVGPDQLAVGLEARQLARARAGRQDDVLGARASSSPPLSSSTASLPLPASLAVAVEHRDLVLLHQVRRRRGSAASPRRASA